MALAKLQALTELRLMENPFVEERGAIHEFANPSKPNETFRMVAHPIRSGGDAPLRKPAPKLGADTERILDELGLSKTRIKELQDLEII